MPANVPHRPAPPIDPHASRAEPHAGVQSMGTSSDMRRFSCGIRAIVAVLCTMLLVTGDGPIERDALIVLLSYDLWASAVLWAEASGRTPRHSIFHYWIDVIWAVSVIHLTDHIAAPMMVMTLVQPVVLASIGHSVREGVVLAMVAALGLLVNLGDLLNAGGVHLEHNGISSALAVLGVVPLAALLSRPMTVLRQRLELVRDLEGQLDPRRGLDAVAATLVDALRVGVDADLVGLVLPSDASGQGLLSTAEDGAFRVNPGVHAQFEAGLDGLPPCPTTHVVRSWFGLRGGTRVHGNYRLGAEQGKALDQLARLLEMQMLIVVPLTRYDERHGHLVVGLRRPRLRVQEVSALADAAPELFRLIDQAALVDRLQEESAAHERVRIGRDLHDSAIQPYLGLKYAVEAVACRFTADNPMRAEIDALLELVNGEIGVLREVISGLRIGEARGDNALVPAVRRQVRRFGLLFGIEVELQCPDEINTSRALAGALFHMVNEAMNNVRKHSAARRVRVSLAQHGDGTIDMRVRELSAGGPALAEPNYSPRSLKERAAAVGGSLTLQRSESGDPELFISVPPFGMAT